MNYKIDATMKNLSKTEILNLNHGYNNGYGGGNMHTNSWQVEG
jgi:hypothetical protein